MLTYFELYILDIRLELTQRVILYLIV
uniref:Uncharacterized protein n=1 Tax=Rhizophora mucronata TaxID=61149 RepID=A0A2P2QHX8_RHIMU